MSVQKNLLILIDGSSYLYRAFHALPALSNSKGKPTGAVYGLTNMLRKLLTDYKPHYIAMVFDAKGKTFRDELYPKYKANREAMPNDLCLQIEPIHQIVKALGLPILMIEGVEADDVIGTLSKQAEHHGLKTLISTSDKDLAQLVDNHITLVNTMTGSVLNQEGVKEKFGIEPNQVIDYLALVGDPIDNIPGVTGVGPKTAAKWLQEFGSLNQIISQADNIPGKVGGNLRQSLPLLPLSKQLATIKLDVSLPIQFSDLKKTEADKGMLIKLFQELEFKSWLAELLAEETNLNQEKYTHYETITTEDRLTNWLKKINSAGTLSLKLETTDTNYMDAEIIGLSFAIETGEAAYLPIQHDSRFPQLPSDLVWKKLKPLLENPLIKKIGHHLKYDLKILHNHQINLKGITYDVMLESYLLDSASSTHDLTSLALKYLGRRMIHLADITGKGLKEVDFNQIDLTTATKYAAEKADILLQLHQLLWPRINKESGLKTIYNEIELPLLPVLAQIEQQGVLIDAMLLKQQTEDLEKRLLELEKEIFSISKMHFNLNSPKQLQEILFNQLKLPILQKTPKGQPSTADGVLQELAMEYLFPKLIIEHRGLTKLITTYTKKLPLLVNTKTHRIHTDYNQTVASTGRLSSSDPNLQNIPIRTIEGRRIRQAFVAPQGYQIIKADYSQIELRIMAHMSNDPTLLHAFEQNLDIHAATAAEVLSLPIEKVSSEERRKAKVINFGLIYGMSAYGLGKELGLDREAAQNYIDRYFTRYPNVKAYMQQTTEKAHAQGFVETLTGRRLYLPDINSSQIPRRKAAERAAINAPLQGTAADIIKKAMISIAKWLEEHHTIDAKMIMQVHDELVFEVAEKNIDQMISVIRDHMMNAAHLKVPLQVSIGTGPNWNEAS